MATSSFAALLALAAHAAALRLPPCAPAHRAPLANFARRARTPVCDEYTLKQQMEAYVKMLRETGRELTPEQEEMLAEIEAEDDSVLEQTGTKFEWSGGASGAPAAAAPPPSPPPPPRRSRRRRRRRRRRPPAPLGPSQTVAGRA